MAAPPVYGSGGGPVAMARGYPGNVSMAAPVAYAPPPQPSYTLDSGDRLRVVVFGQDGLTNSYVVDASGQIAMPLIGPISARGLTTDQLSDRIAACCAKDTCASLILRSRSRPIGRSSSSAKSLRPDNIRIRPT